MQIEFNNTIIENLIRAKISFNVLNSISQIHGGYVKHTYKVIIDDKPYILQIWKEPDTFLTNTSTGESDDIFCNNLDNLLSVRPIFAKLSINIPDLIFSDTTKSTFPYDYCMHEYIDGGNLFENGYKCSEPLFQKELSEVFRKLNNQKRDFRGLIKTPNPKLPPFELFIEEASQNIMIAVKHNMITESEMQLLIDKLSNLVKQFEIKNEYNLIFPDFKPDHILFNKNGKLFLIDYEDVQYFDIEYQHAALTIPTFTFFNSDNYYSIYFKNRNYEIDKKRLLFYQIYRCTSIFAVSIEWLENSKEEYSLYSDLFNDSKHIIANFIQEDFLEPITNSSYTKHAFLNS